MRLNENNYVLVTKVDILVALATILVAVCSHGILMTWAFRNTEDFLLTFAQGLWPNCTVVAKIIILKYLMNRNAAVHFGLIGICTYGMIGNL